MSDQKQSKKSAKARGKAKATNALDTEMERQADSIASTTRIPVSLQQTNITHDRTGNVLRPPKDHSRVKDKKLRARLGKVHLDAVRAKEHAALTNEYLVEMEDAGVVEAEGELERTFKLTQDELKENVGVEAAKKGFELRLGGPTGLGPYEADYTRNGRYLAIAGRKGHIAAFDWQAGKLLTEFHVRETVRDVKWLHNQSFFAVAQKKYVYIYDENGLEVHQLKKHNEVNRMQFLPYHFLLATVGNSGHLKYQDTSTGTLISTHRTGLGSCDVMTQNPHTAVIHLGHANGTVTLWTPNLSTPALKLLAHHGPVSSVAVDPSSGGRTMATSGLDGAIKVWDVRMLGKGAVREWVTRRPAKEIAYSQRGLLGVGWGNHVSIYAKKPTHVSTTGAPPGPYLTLNLPGTPAHSMAFCPFEDVLGVGHNEGFTSMLVPGAGEPNFDSAEADPYETRNQRREREVRMLLDKIQPDMITLDPDTLGALSRHDSTNLVDQTSQASHRASMASKPYARMSRIERLRADGKMDDDGAQGEGEGSLQEQAERAEMERSRAPARGDERETKKMRGKNKSMKRFLKKKKKNVIDPTTVAIREKLAKQRERRKRERELEARGGVEQEPSALDVFKKAPRRF